MQRGMPSELRSVGGLVQDSGVLVRERGLLQGASANMRATHHSTATHGVTSGPHEADHSHNTTFSHVWIPDVTVLHVPNSLDSGTTPCRMTGVTLYSHVRHNEIQGSARALHPSCTGLHPHTAG